MNKLEFSPILITGATGLIGSRVTALALQNGYQVTALVRDEKKARRILGMHPNLQLQIGDITSLPHMSTRFVSIVHGANPTSSKGFLTDPVGTISACVDGTKQLLQFAKENGVSRFLYLSSCEVYGQFNSYTVADETTMGTLDPFTARASYPEAKRLCESLCAAYGAQCGLKTIVARLGVTFGPIMDTSDNRLIAQFARCVKEGRDIVLQTIGTTVRSYCYVDDTAHALLLLLEKGSPNVAYNVAHPEMTLSVREIAEHIAAISPNTNVIIKAQGNAQAQGYLPELQLKLDTGRIQALGWSPKTSFDEGFMHVMESVCST